jgi:hypothetical protein
MRSQRFPVLALSLVLFGCTLFMSSKTPEGVDVSPIYSLTLNGDVKDLDAIERLLPPGPKHYRNDNPETLFFCTPKDPCDRTDSALADTAPQFFFLPDRTMEISRFDSGSAALSYYQGLQTTFGPPDYKLFKHEGTDDNRFFSAYRPKHTECLHGMPLCRGINDADILVTFLKRNMVIVVSYSEIRDKPNYVAAMDSDIVYVADLVKRSLAPAN